MICAWPSRWIWPSGVSVSSPVSAVTPRFSACGTGSSVMVPSTRCTSPIATTTPTSPTTPGSTSFSAPRTPRRWTITSPLGAASARSRTALSRQPHWFRRASTDRAAHFTAPYCRASRDWPILTCQCSGRSSTSCSRTIQLSTHTSRDPDRGPAPLRRPSTGHGFEAFIRRRTWALGSLTSNVRMREAESQPAVQTACRLDRPTLGYGVLIPATLRHARDLGSVVPPLACWTQHLTMWDQYQPHEIPGPAGCRVLPLRLAYLVLGTRRPDIGLPTGGRAAV